MWWFIIYFVISYLFFTFSYFYLYNEHEFPQETKEWKKDIIVVICSLFIGLFWPIILILLLFSGIYKILKKK